MGDEEHESRLKEGAEDVNKKGDFALLAPLPPPGPVVRWERFLPVRSLKVLLVEDDYSTRHVVSALLRNCGYEVTAVANGIQAWKILQDLTNHVDLVLTEVVMPFLSGFGLLCKIRNHKTRTNVPVIMMSSNDSMGTVFKCLSKGAVDFLVKPIRKNELKNLWQHVWRRCHSSSGSGSESGIRAQKSSKSQRGDNSDNNTGSNEDGSGSTSPNVRDGSDNGSGTQGSWTNCAIESDSQQPISCSDNTADRHDSACAQVIHPKPDTFCNESAPFSTTRDFQEQMESAERSRLFLSFSDTGFNGKELEVGVDRHLEHKSNVTEKVSIYLTGPSMDQLPENDTKKEIHYNVLELECSNPISSSTQAANLLDGIPKATNTHIVVAATEAGNHFMEIRDNTTEEFKVPSLELCLRSSRSNDEDGIIRKAVCNVLRHSNQSAFSRYTTSAASSQAPSGCGRSFSLPSDRRLQAVKTDLTDTNMIASSVAALTPGTNGNINDHDKGSTTKIDFFRLEPGMEKLASSSAVGCLNLSTFDRVQHGTSTQQVTQKEIDNAGSAIAGQHMGVHHQVQLQHHHHHYHHHHYHVHGMQEELQPTDNHDQSLLTHMEAVAPQCVSSSRFVRQMETNTANCSINGSYSGSNHGSNGPNGSCAAEIGRAMNTDNDNDNPEGGAEGGNGSSNAEDQNCLSQRESALHKFRQKRKERNFEKKVRYQSRKRLAEQRPRFRGQFARHCVYESTSGEAGSKAST